MVAQDVARSSDFYTGVLGGEVVTPAQYVVRHSDRSSAATSRPPTSTTGLPGPESPTSPRSSTTKPCPETPKRHSAPHTRSPSTPPSSSSSAPPMSASKPTECKPRPRPGSPPIAACPQPDNTDRSTRRSGGPTCPSAQRHPYNPGSTRSTQAPARHPKVLGRRDLAERPRAQHLTSVGVLRPPTELADPLRDDHRPGRCATERVPQAAPACGCQRTAGLPCGRSSDLLAGGHVISLSADI